MSEYGCWNHESSGFIFGRSSKSLNEFYILTEGDAVVRWNDQKQLKTPRCVSFHLMKNIDIDAKQEVNHVITYEEIARFAVVFGIVHPKYLKTKLAEYNIAIITINDSTNKLEKIKPLKLTQSTNNYKNYNHKIIQHNIFNYISNHPEEKTNLKND
eukprot:833099_1